MFRDRAVLLTALIVLTALCWADLIHDANGLTGIPSCCAVADARLWGWGEFWALFIMWSVMMIGMMVPIVAPVVLLYATVNRKRQQRHSPYVPAALFLVGYLLVWVGFSGGASAVQWGLHRAALMSPSMITTNRYLGGGLLILAGVFQLTPAKNRCLAHCRSPLDFLLTDWREGYGGAIVMGLRHGVSCTVCCWMLMVMLFVVGVMNLLWVAAITAFVLLEKTVRAGPWIPRISGVCLILWGLIVLV